MLFDDLDNDAITPEDLLAELDELFVNNPQISMVQQLNALRISGDNLLVLLLVWWLNDFVLVIRHRSDGSVEITEERQSKQSSKL